MLIQRLLQQGHPFREQELRSIRRYLIIMQVLWELFKLLHQRKKALKKLSNEYTDIPSCYLLSTITIPKSQENPIDLMYTGRLDIDKEWSNAVRIWDKDASEDLPWVSYHAKTSEKQNVSEICQHCPLCWGKP